MLPLVGEGGALGIVLVIDATSTGLHDSGELPLLPNYLTDEVGPPSG